MGVVRWGWHYVDLYCQRDLVKLERHSRLGTHK
jgi:hypothetical protein